ncbi:hypothetical protein GCM10025783_27860 [Amnibacterium soli]|uniref:D-inositol 3-phosphate glycosyltransferase n=1 Tax=Amnibacterium soli TaxID=1282736 RepID=A0ABP8ZD60_9MICO
MSAKRLLVLSYAYAPGLGGIERVSGLLVEGFRERGWDVRVVTSTAAQRADPTILRRPSPWRLIRALRGADAVVQSNVSLGLAWPLALRLVRRPWIVVNHTPIADPATRRRRRRDLLKVGSLPKRSTYAVSEFLRALDTPAARVMPNPYDHHVFRTDGRTGDRPLLFVGRLTPAKGVDVLIDALSRLASEGRPLPLTVVGDGEQRTELEDRVRSAGLDVAFLGALPPEQVADAMRRHRVLVVPSRPTPPEAFGLVAIEAIACGCRVVGTAEGGLPEAIGPCGRTVPVDDVAALATAISVTLDDGPDPEGRRDAHLRPYRLPAVLDAYEAALEAAGLGR